MSSSVISRLVLPQFTAVKRGKFHSVDEQQEKAREVGKDNAPAKDVEDGDHQDIGCNGVLDHLPDEETRTWD
jgi:hypothetical protein